MTKSLRPNSTLENLKKEAKSIQKAHKAMDPRCCPVLRNLHQFKGKDNSEIFSSELPLQEIQFALAMDYGFNTWNELKTHVEKHDSKIRFLNEEGKTWLKGIPPKRGKNSVLSVLSSCLQSQGKFAPYWYVMGVSTHAFRLQFDWCGSAPHSFCGYNTANPALKALGYSMRQYSMNHPSHRDDIADPDLKDVADGWHKVKESIDAGIPGLMNWEESQILAGYEMPVDGKTGLINARGKSVEKMPWSVGILTKEGKAPSKIESVIWSLRTGVEHSKSETLSGPSWDEKMVMTYPAGFTAWDKWINELSPDFKWEFQQETPTLIDELNKDSRGGLCLGNAWAYECLLDARYCASRYLEHVSSLFSPDAETHLLKAAKLFWDVGESIESGWGNIRYPWWENGKDWNADLRTAQAEVMKRTLPIEQKAFAELEKALELIDDK